MGFIVITMPVSPETVAHIYSGRATAKQWIKEGQCALKCPAFRLRRVP